MVRYNQDLSVKNTRHQPLARLGVSASQPYSHLRMCKSGNPRPILPYKTNKQSVATSFIAPLCLKQLWGIYVWAMWGEHSNIQILYWYVANWCHILMFLSTRITCSLNLICLFTGRGMQRQKIWSITVARWRWASNYRTRTAKWTASSVSHSWKKTTCVKDNFNSVTSKSWIFELR